MKKTISALFALLTVTTLSGCGSTNENVSTIEQSSSNYKIENLDLTNTKIIENTPISGKWQKLTFDYPKINKQSADRMVKMAAGYGVSIDKDDIKLRLYEMEKEFAPLSEFDEYIPDNLDEEKNYPFVCMLYCSDDFYIEVQTATGGMVELDNRKSIKSVLDCKIDYEAPWRPSFGGKQNDSADINDEVVLDGKTLKVADAIKNAEKFVAENDVLFPKSFGAKVTDVDIFTYENGNQSLALNFEYIIDGVTLEGAPSYSIEDENGNNYKQHPVLVQCAMLTENTIDWIWFPVIEGATEFTSEDCDISVSREQACEIVSKKLSQEYKFNVEEIQLMYAARRMENGKYSWEPAKSIIEPVWRFHLTGIKSQEYSALYVYVSAVDGEVQISQVMR